MIPVLCLIRPQQRNPPGRHHLLFLCIRSPLTLRSVDIIWIAPRFHVELQVVRGCLRGAVRVGEAEGCPGWGHCCGDALGSAGSRGAGGEAFASFAPS